MMVIYLNINHLDYIIKEPKKIKTNDACMRRSPSSFSFPDYSDIPGIYFNFGEDYGPIVSKTSKKLTFLGNYSNVF